MVMASSVSFWGPNYGLQIENNYGSINAQFHLPPDDSEAPNPISTVPFDRDPDFIEPGLLSQKVTDICSKPAARLALVGPGGIGKSQIAIEHAYRTPHNSPDTWVFWIHASSSARFELSYRLLADRVKIPARIDPNANIFKLVHDWLQDSKHGPWIMILDSLDNDDFLRRVPSPGVALSNFLPRCQHGSVIFTTRSYTVAEMYATAQNIITVDPDESHSVALMRKKLRVEQDYEDSDVTKLVRALACMPLAVVQAAAYITKLVPRFTVTQYLKGFQKSDRKRVKLLEHEAGNLHRDWEAKSSILSAADLLALMSFFDAQGIPEILLRDAPDESDDDNSINLDHFSQDGGTVQMHKFWKSQFVRNLLRAFPTGDPILHWEKCRALYQHVQRALSQRPNSEERLKDWALLLYRGAEYAQTSKNPQEAQELMTKSKIAFKKILGPEHPHTISSGILQAMSYLLEGRRDDAEESLSRLLRTCESALGISHHVTLQAKDNLAEIYYYQSRFKDAESLWEQVLQIRKASLGEHHASTLVVEVNLGISYTNAQNLEKGQTRFRKGFALLSEVLELRKRDLPEDHPSILIVKSSVSGAYIEQGKLKEAEEMEVALLESYKKIFGGEHQCTLFSVVKLGSIYTYVDRLEDALPYGIEAVEYYRKTLGEKTLYTIGSMGNLTIMYGRLGLFKEAELLAQAVFEAKRESLGERNTETIDAMETLAMVYEGLKRDKEASSLRWEVTKARADAYRDKHRRGFSVNNLLSLTAKLLVSGIDRFE
ncbi:TPR-like protein [Penicillium malachiteum]|uniref:TPR-like protein n=1 Tax=Penicillium malachiteum TaxID=1324776 RepID=UPI002547F940|nr:TPR-like protein [Penicillium malachiteum]KAJ5721164.1 TPR-like protein [Penicillium malachiteum]